ncbi:MAG: pyridoxal phosphate-dependent aminotransferase [Chitinophagaceae bacterium]|nr:pyridoxal phosphate-dependent aminotransferase [Chitinophagaceae bacterium]MCZ2396786.1 pyridoxal phosphate-dependent aminotransferase [Chitinophagales bacterium]
MELSSLLDRFSEPETLKMAKLGRELRAKGIDVIDLSLGEPDFNTPEHIKEAAKKAIDDNYSHYTPVAGFLETRNAVIEKLKRDNGLTYTPEQILISTGAKQSIANVMMAILEKGKEIVIPTPYWVSYSEIARMAGGEVVFINTTAAQGYKITPEQLEAAITENTRLFIFSSPCNPTGSVYSQKELEGLAAVFEKHPEVFIISDEIYEYINYTGNAHQSLAQFESIRDRVIIINGLSKGFAMTGWRIGYVAAHKDLVKACEKIQGQFTSGTNSIAQRATIAALTESLEPSFAMVEEFTRRRKRVMELLKDFPLLSCVEPDGAFYVFPEVKNYFGKKAEDGSVIQNSSDLCMYLLNTAHVSTVAGSAFGAPDNIRLSFANSLKNIEEGYGRIKAALDKLS